MKYEALLSLLAKCFLEGEQDLNSLVLRCQEALKHPWEWIQPLVQRYLEARESGMARSEAIAEFINRDPDFRNAWRRHAKRFTSGQWKVQRRKMRPVEAAKVWDVPQIRTERELADWFWLEEGQLEWFADLCGLGHMSKNAELRHCHYRLLEKSIGGLRLIEAPKRRLKEMQRQILDLILGAIPVHAAVHGFVKGRSIQTFAQPHVGKAVVLRMDIKNFFPTFRCARIQALFRTIGYPVAVAWALGGLCTAVTPKEICKRLEDETYSKRHLPQGAPSSPALAKLCAYRMDCRLAGLAKSAGLDYTRYADDLAFSGEGNLERFGISAAAILLEEGFEIRHQKTRLMREGVRQHVAGLVTNRHLNIRRQDFDELKATLTNCVQFGPENQNRNQHAAFREHLNGRISFVENVNAAKGTRLRAIYSRIDWPLL